MSSLPMCEHCGERPSACVGAYEGEAPAVVCDVCCGHGCEDGRCDPLGDDWRAQVAEWVGRAAERAAEDAEDHQR